MKIEKYGNRFFAVYDGIDLVCVTVYRKGAVEVIRRLEAAAETRTVQGDFARLAAQRAA